MKIIIIIASLLLSGCATQPWDWCQDPGPNADLSDLRVPVRTAGCQTVSSGYIDQKHLRTIQTNAGITAKKVQVVK